MVFVENNNQVKVDASLKSSSTPQVNLTSQDRATLALLKQSSQSLKLATEPQKSSTSTESNQPDQTNPVLEALIASIETNALIQKENAQSLSVILNSVSSQINSLQDLKNEIEDLSRKLGQNLTPAEVQAVEAKLAALKLQYENALNQEEADQKDISKCNSENQQLEKENEALEKQAANEKDPAKKNALENQITQNKQKMQGNQSKINKDQAEIKVDGQAIYSAIAGIKGLENSYPSLKTALDEILSCMNQHQDASSEFTALTSALDAMAKEDVSLVSEIANLKVELSSLEQALSSGIQTMESLIQKFTDQEPALKEEALLKSLQELISQFNLSKIVDNDQRTENLKIDKKSVKYSQELLSKRQGLIES